MRQCLVVDDSAAVRSVVRGMLEDLNFGVCEAANGHEALGIMRQARPDVVLLDWNMPLMDGLDFLSALQAEKRTARIRVIFCATGYVPEKIVMAMAAGASEYLIKPFDRDLLEQKLLGTCGRSADDRPEL
jgi:two-component system chemotaxis response regulator CheY